MRQRRGVYMARAMLNMDVEDMYPILRKANTNVTSNQIFFLNCEVYPNPSYGVFNFSFVNLTEEVEIEIANAIGQQINSHILDFHTPNFIVDLSKYESGVYFYRIKGKTSNILLNGKLINIKL